MIRAAFLRPGAISTARSTPQNNSCSLATVRCLVASMSSSASPPIVGRSLSITPPTLRKNYGLVSRSNSPASTRPMALRSLSSSTSSQKESSEGGKKQSSEGGDPDSQELVLTPGEKVVAGTRLAMWAGALGFASVCAYYIVKELLPTKMSPNTVFDRATDVVRGHGEVKSRFGEPLKTYGRDHGGHREGRRNFIEHTEYTDADDGSKRVRVRFNLEGAHGAAFVFAEVSKDMPSGEFVYVLVQDKRNGAVITVQDNRSALLAKRLAGGSQEGQNVFSNLLGGGTGK